MFEVMFDHASTRSLSKEEVQNRTMTFLAGRVTTGTGREYEYASVETSTSGNSSLSPSAILLTARRIGPAGLCSSAMMAASCSSWQ